MTAENRNVIAKLFSTVTLSTTNITSTGRPNEDMASSRVRYGPKLRSNVQTA